MLTSEVIHPSTSAFSSPGLLVKEKYGSCVDYKAINKITIKDRFSIPTIDELLHELHSSKLFPKLELGLGIIKFKCMNQIYTKLPFGHMKGITNL